MKTLGIAALVSIGLGLAPAHADTVVPVTHAQYLTVKATPQGYPSFGTARRDVATFFGDYGWRVSKQWITGVGMQNVRRYHGQGDHVVVITYLRLKGADEFTATSKQWCVRGVNAGPLQCSH